MTSTTTIHTTDLYPDSVHTAFRALAAALGRGQREHYDRDHENLIQMHPVFGLLQHGRGEDEGRAWCTSSTTGARGDVLTVPFYLEGGEVGVLETSFHKGETAISIVTFPEAPAPIVRAMYELLQECETR